MTRIDLDAVRKAREEKQGDPHEVVLGGETFHVPAAAPAAFLVGLGRLQKGDMSGLEEALSALFPDPAALERILKLGLDLQDLEPLVSGVYGIDVGEAPASGQ